MSEIDRATLIRAFNDHLFEFLEDVSKLLPENREMMTAIRSFQTVIALNKSIIIKCWYFYQTLVLMKIYYLLFAYAPSKIHINFDVISIN